ncbi:unnamed protein product [Rotaria sp. Silwood1]|nr:unnamed protein product [Rotaria sp. Silwood1]CAF4667923.1 unnamed protein product [Rotaria sp. Silwood1]
MAKNSRSNKKTTNNSSFNQYLIPTNKENKESVTIIWFDPYIGLYEDAETTREQIRRINDYIIYCSDIEQCMGLIQLIHQETIFFITTGSTASKILPIISAFRQIDSIFIFCMNKDRHEHLLNEYSNIIGIYVHLNDLCNSIKEQIDFIQKHIQTCSFFDRYEKSTKDLSKESAHFLWFQLFRYVIIRLPKTQNAKQHMIQMCKQYYRGNRKQMKLIYDFEQNYQSTDAIRWYSKQSFIYKLINKALRIEDIDLLYAFRFFIADLSENLRCEHEKILLSEEKILTVYRGVKMAKEEFNKIKENKGKLISLNGYVSTSRKKPLALHFALKSTKRIDVIPVLFHIECDLKTIDKNIVFADIVPFSDHPDEEEILFDLNTCFKIISIEENDLLKIIKMKLSNQGQKITKDFIELTQKETEELSVSIVFGRLLCNLGKYDRSQEYFQQLLNDSNDEDRAWIEFNLGRALDFKGEWNEARKYYDSAYDQMMKNEPVRIKDSAHVLNNIGNILYRQGKYDEALDYHRRALKIRETFYPIGHTQVADSLNNIGIILYLQEKYDEALEYFQQARTIQEKLCPSGNAAIATSIIWIGNIHKDQEKFNEALNYYQQALEIQKKFYPSDHADIAHSFNNIGAILNNQGKLDEALDYHQQALKMREKVYSSDHIDIAQSLNNIGLILKLQGKYNEALDYHQRALKIREKFYPSGHVDTAFSLNSIGNCYENQNKQTIALDYYQRALAIYEKLLPIDNPSRQRTENNIRRLTEKT